MVKILGILSFLVPELQKKTFFDLASLGVAKSFWKCEKWILYKILHRSWYPKHSPEIFFSMKNIILKNVYWNFGFCKGKICFPLKKYFFVFQRKIVFSFTKFKNIFLKTRFRENIFCFSKLFFSSKKFESEKFLDIKIDVKFYRESIFRTPESIRAL